MDFFSTASLSLSAAALMIWADTQEGREQQGRRRSWGPGSPQQPAPRPLHSFHTLACEPNGPRPHAAHWGRKASSPIILPAPSHPRPPAPS